MVDGYWQAVLATGVDVPSDRPLDELTAELVGMLGHPDPRRRDRIAYTVLASWIGLGVYDDLLVGIGDGLAAGMRQGLGEDGTDSVLRRSFSALVLAEAIARDNEARLLTDEQVLAWGDRATSWLLAEQDLRGYVEGRGWAHPVAHGADLLGMLARSRHLSAAHLTVLLEVVADRLLTPTTHVLRHGEDDRLAHAVLCVLHRDLVDDEALETWMARLGAGLRHPDAGRPELVEWPSPAAANTRAFLRSLHLQLAVGVRGRSDVTGDAELFGHPPRARADVLLGIVDQQRAASPWLFGTPGKRALGHVAR